jgi:hypothetical protein
MCVCVCVFVGGFLAPQMGTLAHYLFITPPLVPFPDHSSWSHSMTTYSSHGPIPIILSQIPVRNCMGMRFTGRAQTHAFKNSKHFYVVENVCAKFLISYCRASTRVHRVVEEYPMAKCALKVAWMWNFCLHGGNYKSSIESPAANAAINCMPHYFPYGKGWGVIGD